MVTEFALGDVPCFGWKGIEKAGKTALIIEVASRGIDDTDIVPFIIKTERAGMDNRRAFASITLAFFAQLAGKAHTPPVADTARLPLQWLHSLCEAADACASVGRRLLLLIDGLDEDSALGRTDAGSASIASLLPADSNQLPRNVRILVTTRPMPALPRDVPPSHWLHDDSYWQRLRPIAVAEQSVEPSEIDSIMDSALGCSVVAFILAAEGPLTSADIATLTQTPVTKVERLLSRRTSRNLVAVDLGAGVGYQIGHASTAERIVLNLSPSLRDIPNPRRQPRWSELQREILRPFRAQINAMADACEAAGWPLASTPRYLASSSFVLSSLSSADGLERATRLLTDPSRQQTVRILSDDADEPAAQIWKVAQRLDPKRPEDFRSIEALLDSLEHLADDAEGRSIAATLKRVRLLRRTRPVEPAKLPRIADIQADLYCELLRATTPQAVIEFAARQWRSSSDADAAIEAVARALHRSGLSVQDISEPESESHVASWTKDVLDRLQYLIDASKAVHLAKREEAPKDTAGTQLPGTRDRLTRLVTYDQVNADGHWCRLVAQISRASRIDDALQLIPRVISNEGAQRNARMMALHVYAGAGNWQDAFDRALEIFEPGEHREATLALVIPILARDGREREAVELAHSHLHHAHVLQRTLGLIVEAAVANDLLEWALALTRREVTLEPARSRTWFHVLPALARSGRPHEALELADKEMGNPDMQQRTRAVIEALLPDPR